VVADLFEGQVQIDDLIMKREYVSSNEGDHTRLCHTEIYHKDKTPKATIAFIHGLGEGSDLFCEYGMQFAMNGYKFEAIDLRGYGNSGGIRGDSTLVEMQNDIVTLLKEVDAEIPLFLIAHSMGCMISSSFLMNNPDLNISGVILQAPLTGPPKHVHLDPVKIFLANFLGQNLPELMLSARINPTCLTKKAVILKYFLTSTKSFPILGTRQITNLLQFFIHYKYNVKSFEYPVLVHLGGEDSVVNNDFTKKMYEQFGSEDKQMFEYEGAFHDLHVEDCSKEMFKNTINWINLKFKEGNATKIGTIDFDKVKIAFLKKKAPFNYWKQLITFSIALYYFIGYLVMVTKLANADRMDMLAFWPCSLYKKYIMKK
jgi:alpha-beta hydrolase superfamily lysophospholipase